MDLGAYNAQLIFDETLAYEAERGIATRAVAKSLWTLESGPIWNIKIAESPMDKV